jgi:hypothetical protein
MGVILKMLRSRNTITMALVVWLRAQDQERIQHAVGCTGCAGDGFGASWEDYWWVDQSYFVMFKKKVEQYI